MIGIKPWLPGRPWVMITYDDDPERPGALFPGAGRGMPSVSMDLKIFDPTSGRSVLSVPMSVDRVDDESRSHFEVDSEFAKRCVLSITVAKPSRDHVFHIPLELFNEDIRVQGERAKDSR